MEDVIFEALLKLCNNDEKYQNNEQNIDNSADENGYNSSDLIDENTEPQQKVKINVRVLCGQKNLDNKTENPDIKGVSIKFTK